MNALIIFVLLLALMLTGMPISISLGLTVQEQAEWRRALAPVQKAMEGRIGKDLISAINKESAK